jgi:hypothetical protein
MQPVGSPSIGLTATSVWSYGPKIAHFRPTVEDGPKYLEDVKYTSSDISQMMFTEHLPSYSPASLSPRIPTLTAKIGYRPVNISIPQASTPSTTALLVNKAKAIKTYQAIA